MAIPREFDREIALERATGIFWAKGYASTSTEDLLAAMGIGRQSLYNAFGDKRALYLRRWNVISAPPRQVTLSDSKLRFRLWSASKRYCLA